MDRRSRFCWCVSYMQLPAQEGLATNVVINSPGDDATQWITQRGPNIYIKRGSPEAASPLLQVTKSILISCSKVWWERA